MGYRPNWAARSLVSRRSNTIGVIVRHLNDPYYSNLLQEIHRSLIPRNYVGAFFSARNLDEFRHAVDNLASRRVEGIITVPPTPEERRLFRDLPTPVVYYGHPAELEEDDSFIGPDHRQGALLAMQHLYDLGHRAFGYLGVSNPHEVRERAFLEFLDQVRLPRVEEWIRYEAHPTSVMRQPWDGNPINLHDVGCQQMKCLLNLKKRPSAVLCQNDILAIGAQRALIACGISVPHEMALVGFDNLPESRYAAVPLTSVDFHVERAARMLVDAIFHLFEKPGAGQIPIRTLLAPSLKTRESTRPPPLAELSNPSASSVHRSSDA